MFENGMEVTRAEGQIDDVGNVGMRTEEHSCRSQEIFDRIRVLSPIEGRLVYISTGNALSSSLFTIIMVDRYNTMKYN